jgi:hypothetical protein
LTIHQLTVEVSAAFEELITKEVPAKIDAVGADKMPCVPPTVFVVSCILDEAVTAVVLIVIDPAVIAAEVPIEALVPTGITSLFPRVPRTRFPFVAVIAPVVAVTPVPPVTVPDAETFPELAAILPVVAVTPVPPVTVPEAETLPELAAMLPVVAVIPVPAVIVVPAFTAPAVATILPVVEVIPVPAVIVVVAPSVVVVSKDPGVTMAEGRETVATPPTVLTVI